jgi:lipoate-protein ligase B
LNYLKLTPKAYVKSLENLIIRTCKSVGVSNATTTEHTGVWVNDKKIAAIGVNIKRRWCSHGLCLNVCNDVSWFDYIVPCGLNGVGVTSIQDESKSKVSVDEVISAMISAMQEEWGCILEKSKLNSHF